MRLVKILAAVLVYGSIVIASGTAAAAGGAGGGGAGGGGGTAGAGGTGGTVGSGESGGTDGGGVMPGGTSPSVGGEQRIQGPQGMTTPGRETERLQHETGEKARSTE